MIWVFKSTINYLTLPYFTFSSPDAGYLITLYLVLSFTAHYYNIDYYTYAGTTRLAFNPQPFLHKVAAFCILHSFQFPRLNLPCIDRASNHHQHLAVPLHSIATHPPHPRPLRSPKLSKPGLNVVETGGLHNDI